MGKKIYEDNKFYAALFLKFDKALNSCIVSLTKKVENELEKFEHRLNVCDIKVHQYFRDVNAKCQKDIEVAEQLVNKELRSKNIMSQWTNGFLSSSRDETLDPITFAISRFAMNISLSFRDVPPQYIISTNVHKQLVAFLSIDSDLAVGPSCLALMHLSLLKELKSEIVAAGALPRLLNLMVHCPSKTILAQCCKICGSLAIHRPNKTAIANSGCMHALFDLILGVLLLYYHFMRL